MIDSISEPLAYRLRGLDGDSRLKVIVVADNIEGLGRFNSYCVDNEIEKQSDFELLFSSCVNITKRQIYDLAKQPYVSAIMEDGGIDHQ